jgi:hypothetical protein
MFFFFTKATYVIIMDPLILIRDQKLVSNGISMSRVVVFSGGLETEECHFIRMVLEIDLYGRICFSIFIGVTLIYGVFVL